MLSDFSFEFFSSAFAGGLSLYVAASLLASFRLFRVFGWFPQCCSLDSLNSSSDFQLPARFPSLCGSFQVRQLQLVPRSTTCFIDFLVFWQSLSTCLSFSIFDFYSVVCKQGRIHETASFFFSVITRSCLLVRIRWYVWISKSKKSFNISFSITDDGLYISHLIVWSNFNFLLKS